MSGLVIGVNFKFQLNSNLLSPMLCLGKIFSLDFLQSGSTKTVSLSSPPNFGEKTVKQPLTCSFPQNMP